MHLQDPTEQVKIENFMVQQLDGTVNEWGWCKQKVMYHSGRHMTLQPNDFCA